MRRHLSLRGVAAGGTLAVLCAACGSSHPTPTVLTPKPTALPTPVASTRLDVGASAPAVQATNALGLAMLVKLTPGANVVVSPFSVETAMAMADQGAGDAAAAQIDAALGGVASPAALASANRALGSSLNHSVTAYGKNGPTLHAAITMWLQTGQQLQPAFSSTLSDDFGSTPREVDFAHDDSAAVSEINHWVSGETAGLIRNLVTTSSVTPLTQLVLTNAVYLHARWADPFDPSQTAPASFTAPSGSVQVPFMNDTDQRPYAITSRYTAVALDYAHSSLQYLAIMPPAGQMSQLQQWLTPGHLVDLTASLHSGNVALSMPKFQLKLQTSLKPLLQGLGIQLAFRTGLTRTVASPQPLKISDVIHDATLKVAEKGTVAAAATAVVEQSSSAVAPVRAIDVTLDHPFLVLIRDTQTGAILFAARVLDPSA